MNCYFGCRDNDEYKVVISKNEPSRTYSADSYMDIFIRFTENLCEEHQRLVQRILDDCTIYSEDSDNCRNCW